MSNTYTATRQSYYQKNKKLIKKKRKQNYQKNILKERQNALNRHSKNKERNNFTSLVNYYVNDKKLNKKRQEQREPKRQPNVKCLMCKNKFHTKKNPYAKLSKNKPQCPKCGDRIIIFII